MARETRFPWEKDVRKTKKMENEPKKLLHDNKIAFCTNPIRQAWWPICSAVPGGPSALRWVCFSPTMFRWVKSPLQRGTKTCTSPDGYCYQGLPSDQRVTTPSSLT